MNLSRFFLICFLFLSMSFANAGDLVTSSQEIDPLSSDSTGVIDYEHAIPMPMPTIEGSGIINPENSSSALPGEPGVESGGLGSGESGGGTVPESIVVPDDSGFGSQEYGSNNHPYTTSRIDSYYKLVKKYPNRATGKLFFNIDGGTYVCSASLIKPGIVVTAAHCVAEFGGNRFYTDFIFIPAYYQGTIPYNKWKSGNQVVMTSYINGSDDCYASGVVCKNDVAVIILNPRTRNDNGKFFFAGHKTGWYAYGWNGFGFTGGGLGDGNLAHISQLGYPVSHDSGAMMQRTDSQAFTSATYVYNSVMGSRQTGGSSGGPWMANLGQHASLSGTNLGSEAQENVVVGVTSWGYTSDTPKQQGASPFTDGNIVPLVDHACAVSPDNCDKMGPWAP